MSAPSISADAVLHYLMADGDVFEVEGLRFLVAPIYDDQLQALIVAFGATEDMEEDDPGGDDTEDEGEQDGGDDEPDHDNEPSPCRSIEAARQRVPQRQTIVTAPDGRRGRWVPVR